MTKRSLRYFRWRKITKAVAMSIPSREEKIINGRLFFGETSETCTNPEIVAPLDKLREYINRGDSKQK